MKRKYLSALAALVVSVAAVSAPVWKVEKGDNHVFLGGTIHNLSETEYPLPDVFGTVYEQADEVVFEFDVSKLGSPEVQAAMLQSMTYKNGQTIADDLQQDTLAELKASLTARGLPYEKIANLKASLMGLTLISVEMQRLGLVGKGVDKHFHELAVADGKTIGWLETVDTQVATLASFGEGQEDEYIRYVLDSLRDKKGVITEMEKGWRSADIDALSAKLLSPMKQRFPDVYNTAVIERNDAWLPQIEAMLEDDDTELVLVGVLHFAGEDSLMRKLKDRGYKISRM